jgi:type IV secretion system protein TrbL
MASLPRAARAIAAAALLAAALTLGDPTPPAAQAIPNPMCATSGAVADQITGAVGIGSPVGDVCDAVTGGIVGEVTDRALGPLRDAARSVGQGIFRQIGAWAAEGAVWLLGEVAKVTTRTTTPDLLGKPFVRKYREMAVIAALMAALMVLLAVFESLARGDSALLLRVLAVNLPLAALATSAAYVVVQLLIGLTDGLCEAIASGTAADTRAFFSGAAVALERSAGALPDAAEEVSGVPSPDGLAVVVPLFVGFIVAVLAACAAFFVWIELLMRDAAIYVVALFLPLALAASIWPRWASSLRRTCELVIVIVFSKFVIVAVIALGASLLAHGKGVESILAAAAMLLLACFAPFLMLRLVSFGEGALGAAYGRRNAGSVASGRVRSAASSQVMRRAAQANWTGGMDGASGGGSPGSPGTRRAAAGPAGARDRGGRPGAAAPAGGQAGSAAGVAGAAASGGATVAKGAATRAGQGIETAQAASSSQPASDQEAKPVRPAGETGAAPQGKRGAASGASPAPSAPPRQSGASAAEPAQPRGGTAPGEDAKPRRPSADLGPSDPESRP